MIKFIVTSDLRASHVIEENMHIGASVIKKVEDITNVADDCNFIADLGDCLDGNASPNEGCAVLDDIYALYNRADIPLHMLMGERTSVVSKEAFLQHTNTPFRYRAFDVANYRCIFLDAVQKDGNFYIDDEQFDWLSRLLGKSHRTAVIFSHAPIALTDESDDSKLLTNRALLRELIETSDKVALVVSGHSDKGDLVVSNGVPYITISPNCLSDETTFARITVSSRGVVGEGFGAQESFSVYKPEEEPEKKSLFEKIRSLF